MKELRLDNLAVGIVNDIPDQELLQYLDLLDTASKTRFSEKIHNENLQFPLLLSLLVKDEKYWERCCYSRNWGIVHQWFYDHSWKNAFICLHTEELIDDCIGGKKQHSELETTLGYLKDWVAVLKINGYKFNYYPDSKPTISEAESGNTLLEDNIARLLSHFNENLKELHLNNVPINYELTLDIEENSNIDQSVDNLYRSLSSLHNLEKLLMIGTNMTKNLMENFLASLKPLSHLVELNLSCNFISDELCQQIADFLVSSRIEKLVLSRNDIGDVGCTHLVKAIPGSLKHLFLDNNVIGDEGISVLFSSLLSHSFLVKLDVSFNEFTDESTNALCKFLSRHHSLKYLKISGNRLGKDAGVKLCQALESKHQIMFFGCSSCDLLQQDEDAIYRNINYRYYSHV